MAVVRFAKWTYKSPPQTNVVSYIIPLPILAIATVDIICYM